MRGEEVVLPQIFIAAKNPESIGYTEEDFVLENCTLTEDGTKVNVNENAETASITIKGGILDGSKLTITVSEKPEEPEKPENPEEKLTYKFLKYELKEEENATFVTEIQPKTSVQQIIEAIETNGKIKIIGNDKNETEVTTGNVATGNRIIMTKGEESEIFVIVIKGDVNADGDADFKDILQVNKHRLNKVLLKGAFVKAGDVTGDGVADFKDILQINKFRLHKIDTL